ncbi:hypothetical protein PG997_000121 [Apiospora hydei]|uniref:Uncharacterized protein n=1 Tax=Apiospora hydei TaxID=1337664 RepID=A0ABR1X9V9_9PEZI
MKVPPIVLSCAALARAQAIDWDAVDDAPPAPVVIVPYGAVPDIISYDADAAADIIRSIINPPRLPATATRSRPALSVPVPTDLVATVIDDILPPVPTETAPPDTDATIPTASISAPSSILGAAPTLKLPRRDAPCAPQPTGYGPVPSPDTADSFLAYPAFSAAASNAPVPSNYAKTFINTQSSSSSYGYLGFTVLKSYDPEACASQCDTINGCSAINIYFERDPIRNPDDNLCRNPRSTTVIKCVFWGGPVDEGSDKHLGGWIAQFHVVMAGSNGYVKKKFGAVPGYTDPLNGTAVDAAINAPPDCTGANTFMGAKVFTSGPFDVGLCAAACEAQTAYNLQYPPASGAPLTCQLFNTYMLMRDGMAVGQYCAMYTQYWDHSHMTNRGEWRGSEEYTFAWSLEYSNTTDPGRPAGLDTDSKNCGSCGNVCGSNTHCVSGSCRAIDLCQKPVAMFTLQSQGGDYDQRLAYDINPRGKASGMAFFQSNARPMGQVAQFQLDRSSGHLAMLRNSNTGGPNALYANVDPDADAAGDYSPYDFNTEADIVNKGWQYVTCEIVGGQLVCGNENKSLGTNAYRPGSDPRVCLINNQTQGFVTLNLKALCA